MNSSTRNREIVRLTEEVAVLRTASERLGDLFVGLSVFFGVMTVTVSIGGLIVRDPIFAVGAGLALAASAAFALCAHDVNASRGAAPAQSMSAAPSPRMEAMRRAA